MISLKEAKRRADEFQSEGRKLLAYFNLEPKLSNIGGVRVEGSFEYGLMVKPDIDIEVIVEFLSAEPIADLAKELIIEGKAEVVQVVTRHSEQPRRAGVPKGIYMSLKPDFNGRRWNFDIWFHELSERKDAENLGPGWHKKLSQDERDDILLLKWHLSELGRYPHAKADPLSFGSADIYRAVMNDGVKTIEELDEWRKTHPYY